MDKGSKTQVEIKNIVYKLSQEMNKRSDKIKETNSTLET